jgi:1,2-diacylglycerol 3-beta-glucosyltransferase
MSCGLFILSLSLGLICLPALVYLGWLSLLSVRPRHSARSVGSRFAFVVPAHNEASQIAATVSSLRAVDYPADTFEVVVVADNCTDDTAGLAAAAGAKVLSRQHASLKGKGYALEFAFAALVEADPRLDALVVVDADTLVDKDILQIFAGCIASGARAMQGHYGVSNPLASWRTRLIAVAMAMFHRLRSLGRERLGVSAGLRGNGMCFTTALLREHPHQAFGLVEDVEYGIALGRAGIRVVYADAARVYGEMVADAEGSRSQRQRWEGGRWALVKRDLLPLAGAALRCRNPLLGDLAMDLAVPPLSYLGLALGVGTALELVRWGAYGACSPLTLGLWGTGWACLLAYVGRGLVLSELGLAGVSALCWAPFFVGWKVLLLLRPGRKTAAWVRTKRQGE